MKRSMNIGLGVSLVAGLLSASLAWASDAETSATATGGRHGPGTATATARYTGDVGFARTNTRTGEVNIARGVAVGVDKEGLSLSVSLAVAPSHGPAVATNLNMSIDRDGGTASSVGRVVAEDGGDRWVSRPGGERTVSAGGRTSSSGPWPTATSVAAGRTADGGRVKAYTRSDSTPGRLIGTPRVVRVLRNR